MKSLLLLYLSTFTAFAQASYLQQQTTVKALDGKSCDAYLHALPESKGLPVIIALGGTGLYSTGDMVEQNGVLSTVVDLKKAVVVTIDMPRIHFSAAAKNGYTIDDAVFNSHTQRDSVARRTRFVGQENNHFPHRRLRFIFGVIVKALK